jgi:hypothetical protein
MAKSKITRGRFLSTTFVGLAAIKLLPETFSWNPIPLSERRNLGRTGIRVSPVCYGAPRTNNES